MHELCVELAAVAAGRRGYRQHLERHLAVVHAVHDEELRETAGDVGRFAPLLGWIDGTWPSICACVCVCVCVCV